MKNSTVVGNQNAILLWAVPFRSELHTHTDSLSLPLSHTQKEIKFSGSFQDSDVYLINVYSSSPLS